MGLSMSRMVLWVLFIFVFVLPGYSGAEVYMYKDKDGVTHFTNELKNVPEDQRLQMKKLPPSDISVVPGIDSQESEVSDEKPEVASPEASSPPDQEAGDREAEEKDEKGLDEKDKAKIEALEVLKAGLEEERTRVEQEQAALMEKIQRMRMEREIRNLNRDMISVNDRIADLDEKWDNFEQKWETYHDPAKNSPDYQRLKKTKATLDTERYQINEQMSDLLRRGRSIRTNHASRAYKNKMKALRERIDQFRNSRDAYEAEWEAFYPSP